MKTLSGAAKAQYQVNRLSGIICQFVPFDLLVLNILLRCRMYAILTFRKTSEFEMWLSKQGTKVVKNDVFMRAVKWRGKE